MTHRWRDVLLVTLAVMQLITLVLIADFRYRLHHIGEEIGSAFGGAVQNAFSSPKTVEPEQIKVDPVRAAVAPPVPSSASAELEVISIDTRVTETNDMWSRFAFVLVVKNPGISPARFSAKVQWVDDGGFLVDDRDTGDLQINAGETATYTGYKLIVAGSAPNVKKVRATIVKQTADGHHIESSIPDLEAELHHLEHRSNVENQRPATVETHQEARCPSNTAAR
jgi:hypothetical protein